MASKPAAQKEGTERGEGGGARSGPRKDVARNRASSSSPLPPLVSLVLRLSSNVVTDGSHKWCTRDDIIWWMELLSSSLPTPSADPRFDALVRACWGIPPALAGGGGSGGQGIGPLEEGQSMSVLVTHVDGEMSIERVSRQGDEVGVDDRSGDLLMSEAQAERVRRELASIGVHAVHVHLLNSNNDNTPGAANHASAAVDGSTQNGAAGSKHGAVVEGQDSGRRQPSAEEVRIARLGPSGNKHGTSHGVGRFGEGEAGLGFDHGLLRWGRVFFVTSPYLLFWYLATGGLPRYFVVAG